MSIRSYILSNQNQADSGPAKAEVIYSDEEDDDDEDRERALANQQRLSKKKKRQLAVSLRIVTYRPSILGGGADLLVCHEQKLSVAELKQLVSKPEVVEWVDCDARDPRLLVSLKAYRK